MRLDVKHTAYVRGIRHGADGEGKFACTLTTGVEIDEAAVGDAELAFVARSGKTATEYRLWNSMLFRRGMVVGEHVQTAMRLAMLGGGDTLFRMTPYETELERAQADLFGDEGKAVRRISSPAALSSVRATDVRETDIDYWRQKVRDRASWLVLLDGELWERCFEPVYSVVSYRSEDAARLNGARIAVTEPFYDAFVDAPVRNAHGEGLRQPPNNPRSRSPYFHFFSSLEADEAREFSAEIGDGYPPILRRGDCEIAVVQPAAATPSLFDLETARMAKGWHVALWSLGNFGERKGRNGNMTRFLNNAHGSELLRQTVIGWESGTAGAADVLEAFDYARAHGPAVPYDLAEFDLRRETRRIDLENVAPSGEVAP